MSEGNFPSEESHGEHAGAAKWANVWKIPCREEREKQLPDEAIYRLLRRGKIIPSPKELEKLDRRFVFLGTCSGAGVFEERLARSLEQETKDPLPFKPLFIASDRARSVNEKGYAVPPNLFLPGDFPKTSFGFVTADIAGLPFPDRFADVVFENMGAIFYAGIEEFRDILKEYDRVLRPGGKLVVSKAALDLIKQKCGTDAKTVLAPWRQKVIPSDYWPFVVLERKKEKSPVANLFSSLKGGRVIPVWRP